MTIRIDFGRLFPGLVILLIGVAFFVLWLLLVFVSFFAFFVPGLSGIFYLALDILVASLVLMGLGAPHHARRGIGAGGARAESKWGRYGSRADRDRLNPGQRSGEVFSVIVSFLILLFFIENQTKGTGLLHVAFRADGAGPLLRDLAGGRARLAGEGGRREEEPGEAAGRASTGPC